MLCFVRHFSVDDVKDYLSNPNGFLITERLRKKNFHEGCRSCLVKSHCFQNDRIQDDWAQYKHFHYSLL
jgi:hypothetical protein